MGLGSGLSRENGVASLEMPFEQCPGEERMISEI